MPSQFAELLLQILHCDPALPEPECLAALTPAEWEALVAEAIYYRIPFQMIECLKADPRRYALVPEVCLGRLHDAVRVTLMRNLKQHACLHKMLSACQAADLPVILVKGLWLGEMVYRDLRARATGDIDLLFRQSDMPRFTRLVQELGFDLPAGVANICDLVPEGNEFTLKHPTQKSFFDIHWSLTHPIEEKPIDEEKLWLLSEKVTLAGMQCRSLGLEHHLLYLCFHAAIHHRFLYVGPRSLLDVARLIAEPPRTIDWSAVVASARELGWSRGVWLMLDLVRQHLGVQSPQVVLDALRPVDANRLPIHAASMEAMFLGQQHQEMLARNIVRLLDKSPLRTRGALLIERLFPSRESIATQFQTPVDTPGFNWLYVKRLGLLLRTHLLHFVRLVARDRGRTAELVRARVIERWMEEA